MGLISEKVFVGLNSQNIEYYENLGFYIPRTISKWGNLTVAKGTRIEIPIDFLSKGCNVEVECVCDRCGKPLFITFNEYRKNKRNDDKTFCWPCANIYSNEEARKTRLLNGISFEEGCLNNNEKNILDRWDYELNDFNPDEISYYSSKRVYLLCQNNIHSSELKNISNKSSFLCNQCFSLGFLKESCFLYWSDKNEKSPNDYFLNSHIKVYWKCENEIHEDYKRKIQTSVELNFRCPKCSREKSESFLQIKVYNYLIELGFNINKEYDCSLLCINPKTNCPLPYDNEIIKNIFKLIIEIHGKQHYIVEGFNKLSAKHNGTTPEQELEYIQWKDEYKKQFALNNGYYYLAIPYWTDNEDEDWKNLIDETLFHLGG